MEQASWDGGEAARAAVTRASLDAIIIADAEGRVLEFNPAAEAMFGHTRQQALGRSIGELIVPEHHRAAHETGMRRYAAGAAPRVVGRRMELEAMRADGSIFPVELAITEGEANGRRFFAASLRDLTEKRAAEAAQREAEAFLRALVDDQGEIVIRNDADFRVIFCNLAAARFFGLSREALIGRRFTPGMTAEAEAALAAALRALTPENPVRHSVDPKTSPTGETRWLAWSNRALFDEAGQTVGYLSVARDITEALLAERALAASEARFAAFVENAPMAMFLKDAASRYVMLNAEAAGVIGLPRDAILGRTAREVGTPGSADATDAADASVRNTGQPLRVEGRLAAEGQPYHEALVLRFPLPAPDGDGTWIGGFALDLTAQKAAERDLARSREALHQSEKLNAMGSLLAGVAHELNNPLAIVVAQAAMLEEDVAGGPLAKRAERIRRAADRCGRIVQTFLGLARRKPAERRPVCLNETVRAAVELMGYPLRTAGVTLALDLSPDLPVVEGDADMLHQVVLNLLVNAQQALEGWTGERVVRLSTRHGAEAVILDVADTGPGVPPAIRARIFEPFFSTKPQGVGTGVGLSFCHSVATAHHGQLDLLDTPAGAAFRLALPAALTTQTEARPAPTLPETANARALVVDDEAELAETIAEMLAAGGYEVDIAISATEAQDLVAEKHYDLLLSDIRMPGMDGPALYAWLRAEHPALADRIAFVTGDALGAAAAAFLAEAGRPVLEKPFTRDAVLRIAGAASGRKG